MRRCSRSARAPISWRLPPSSYSARGWHASTVSEPRLRRAATMPRSDFPQATRAKVARLRQENPLGLSVQLRLVSTLALGAASAAPPAASARDRAGDGLLFRVSGDKTLIRSEEHTSELQ